MLLRARLFSFKNIITPILGGNSAVMVITHNIESHHSMTQLFCVGAPGNPIGAPGATALVEAFKNMPSLTKLNLGCELCIVRLDVPGL